ncbi:MAG TPA: 50S ribosomal protein L11 methyltransferase [Acetobacteraceae bacterium]|nr:50S ribosomal protein L11 methyltransferase [Acetobacteraceae bacterium]
MAVPETLERIAVEVPESALEMFESAFSACCRAVGFFLDEASGSWIVEGVKEAGAHEAELEASLALARMMTGVEPEITRGRVPAGGWLARSFAGFPEQLIGRRFAVRGTHIGAPALAGRTTIVLDAGLAFGTGEHGSTRGCLVALERVARFHRPRRILDLGTGSGVLGIAAALLWHRRVLATDIDARSVRVARANAAQNHAAGLFRAVRADGWTSPVLRRHAPYDLIFANILARPLAAMAADLARNLAPGGITILAGLLASQENWVISAHRRHGLALQARVAEGAWTTLIMRKRKA